MVTVADDGGSSGRLRRELGLLPPGDLRKALAALAGEDDEDSLWSTVFQHRFGGTGALAGHAVGNLVLAGLLEMLGDPVAALEEAARLLGRARAACCRCAPSRWTSRRTSSGSTRTRPRCGGSAGRWRSPPRRVRCSGSGCTRRARRTRCRRRARPRCTAVLEADVVLLGPGSWFTSVLPHLLVPELHEALIDTPASRMVVLNLVPQPGETAGFSPERHLDVLCEHAPRLRVDAVIADVDSVSTPDRLRRAAEALGATLRLDAIASGTARERHDPAALAESLRGALAAVRAG